MAETLWLEFLNQQRCERMWRSNEYTTGNIISDNELEWLITHISTTISNKETDILSKSNDKIFTIYKTKKIINKVPYFESKYAPMNVNMEVLYDGSISDDIKNYMIDLFDDQCSYIHSGKIVNIEKTTKKDKFVYQIKWIKTNDNTPKSNWKDNWYDISGYIKHQKCRIYSHYPGVCMNIIGEIQNLLLCPSLRSAWDWNYDIKTWVCFICIYYKH